MNFGKLCNANILRLVREVAPADQGKDPDNEVRFVSSTTCNWDSAAQLAGIEPLSRAAPLIFSCVRFVKLDQLAGSELHQPMATKQGSDTSCQLCQPVHCRCTAQF